MKGEKSSQGEWGEFGRPSLPRGRHRLTPAEVVENQRQRLIVALADSVAVRGYTATTVEWIINGAGVSRGTFYEHFANRGECLAAAHKEIFERLVACIHEACAGEKAWVDKVAGSIGVAIEFADSFPNETRLLSLDVTATGNATCQSLAAKERLAEMLYVVRGTPGPDVPGLPGVVEMALVGGVFSVINWLLLRGESLAGLEPQLVYLVLAPYVGSSEAVRTAQSYS